MSHTRVTSGPIQNNLCSIAFWIVVVSLWVLGAGSDAQEKPNTASTPIVRFGESLLDQPPFDLLTTTAEAGGESVRLLPIDFPGRRVPVGLDPSSKLVVTMVAHPDRKYDIRWADIAKIELYEDLVLKEANRLIQAKEHAAAFEHLNYLIKNHPSLEGLEKLRSEFLFASALEMYRKPQFAHALAILEELRRSFPNYRPKEVSDAISQCAETLVQSLIDRGDLRAAQTMVKRLERDYRNPTLGVVTQWNGRFLVQAEQLRQTAISEREAGHMRRSRDAAEQMLAMVPEIEGGRMLLEELIKTYPMIRVGVFELGRFSDSTSLADWPARRSGPLVSKPLFAFRNTGPAGGEYGFAYGTFKHSDDHKELELNLQSGGSAETPSAQELAQLFLKAANPRDRQYRPSWAAIVQEVAVPDSNRVVLRLRQPHVLPQALLQWPTSEIPIASATERPNHYRKIDSIASESDFVWRTDRKREPSQPIEVIEIQYTDPQAAVADLAQGKIDMIDRLYPADAQRLMGIRDVQVGTYALPTVHMLVPKSKHPYLQESTFRRALMYAINRDAVLNGEILGGKSNAECRVVSGPFPLGASDKDPLSYAYNQSILPYPFDPRHAKLLLMLTQQQLAEHASKKKTPAPVLTPLRLGVPEYEAAQVAGEACIQQWAMIEIPAELVVLKGGIADWEAQNIDLLYISAAIWEPATDAQRLFGADGIAATNNPYIVQSLEQLRMARNWREVRQNLQDLHSLVHAHLPILPLWQISDAYAYRSTIRGISKRPMSLYYDLDSWRLEAR